ncbi:MAG: hypothetical protein IPF47_14175 [Gemmatimonadetes bacterium]|nr:hypothetical protein [Gemmatimonadota bacterium]
MATRWSLLRTNPAMAPQRVKQEMRLELGADASQALLLEFQSQGQALGLVGTLALT